MKPMYYTTSEVMALFCWKSKSTLERKQSSGFLPAPDLAGRPNKWLRHKIDAIIGAPNSSASTNQKNDSK